MSRRFGSAAACAASLLLCACASMAPTYERPAAPVAAAYPREAAKPAEAGSRAADIEWQRFFADARVKRLIEVALKNNRDLRVAVLNIEQTRAQYQIQRADRFPTVNAGISGSRQPIGAGQTTTLYQAGLIVTSYELDLFGRVKSLSDAAVAEYFASQEARKAAQISLIASVVNASLAIQADDELLELTRRTLATRDDSLKLAKLRFDVGAASEIDYQQARSLVESARVTLAQLDRQRALDEDALVLLLGQPLPDDLPPSATLDNTALTNDLPAGLPSDLLEQRPDIRQSEQLLRSANANVGAARAAFFPRISLTGSVGTASNQLSGLFKRGSYAWAFSPQVTLPIFDAGRNKASLELSQASRDIAVAQYEKAIQSAFREVADALASRSTVVDQLQAQRAQSAAEEARFRLSDLLYRNGAASYLDLLDAQRALFAAQQASLQAKLLQLQTQVTLYKVLGGGWTNVAGDQTLSLP